MANSKLVSYVWNGSKANCNVRDHAIDTITLYSSIKTICHISDGRGTITVKPLPNS